MSKVDKFHQGDSVAFLVTVWIDEKKTQVKDLTGATIIYRVGAPDYEDTVLELTETPNANGSYVILKVPNTAGQFLVYIFPADSILLPPVTLVHQAIVTDNTGNPDVVFDRRLDIQKTLPPFV